MILMRLKKIILILILFLLTGCTVDYNLVINNSGTIDESLVIMENNSFFGTSNGEVNKQLDSILVFAKDETEPAYFYNHEKILGNVSSGVKYSYSFTFDNFRTQSEFLRRCFENYDLNFESNRVNILASNFMCQDQLGDDFDLNINIQVDGNVVEGNFDKKINNKYTWNVKENNDVSIKLIVNNIANNQDEHSKQQKSNIIIIVVSVLVVLLMLFGILLFGYTKNKQNNS